MANTSSYSACIIRVRVLLFLSFAFSSPIAVLSKHPSTQKGLVDHINPLAFKSKTAPGYKMKDLTTGQQFS